MKNLLYVIFLIPFISFAQVDLDYEFDRADSLLKINQIQEGYSILKELESNMFISDTLYYKVCMTSIRVLYRLESAIRMNEDFKNSLSYGKEALGLIEKGNKYIENPFVIFEPFIIKNLVVSYFGLGNYKESKRYRDLLYQGYKNKTLPEGIDENFNFDFFKLDNKNIYGYENFAKLPVDRFSSSFSKVIYYVYSTNPDGSDKYQLFRLHVLMFHANNLEFDYILEKYSETTTEVIKGSFLSYTYKEDINFKKLHNDVIDIIKNDLQPDTKRTKKR